MALEDEVKELNAGLDKITASVIENSEQVIKLTELTVTTVQNLNSDFKVIQNNMLELQTSIKEVTGLLLNTQRNTEEIKGTLQQIARD